MTEPGIDAFDQYGSGVVPSVGAGILERRGLKDGRRPPFFWVDNSIFEAPVSKHAKLIYMFLCRRCGDGPSCFPSFKDIEAKTSCSHGTVVAALRELEAAGLVQREPRFDEEGTQTSTLYTVFSPPPDTGQPATTLRSTGDHPPGQRATTKKIHPEEDPLKKNLPTTPLDANSRVQERAPVKNVKGKISKQPAPDPLQQNFTRFWGAFPKRASVGQGTKREAWEVWQAIRPSSAETSRMIRALDDADHDGQLYDHNGCVATGPAAWLECWREAQLGDGDLGTILLDRASGGVS